MGNNEKVQISDCHILKQMNQIADQEVETLKMLPSDLMDFKI